MSIKNNYSSEKPNSFGSLYARSTRTSCSWGDVMFSVQLVARLSGWKCGLVNWSRLTYLYRYGMDIIIFHTEFVVVHTVPAVPEGGWHIFVLHKMYLQLLNRLPWHLVQNLKVPKRWCSLAHAYINRTTLFFIFDKILFWCADSRRRTQGIAKVIDLHSLVTVSICFHGGSRVTCRSEPSLPPLVDGFKQNTVQTWFPEDSSSWLWCFFTFLLQVFFSVSQPLCHEGSIVNIFKALLTFPNNCLFRTRGGYIVNFCWWPVTAESLQWPVHSLPEDCFTYSVNDP